MPETQWTEPTVPRWRLSLIREADSEYTTDDDKAPRLHSPGTTAAWLWSHVYHDAASEMMSALYLDSRLRVIGYTVAYVGTTTRAAVEPRGVLVPALLANASSLVLAHNHPSGDPSPSLEDLAFTRRIREAGEAVGVELVDHLILGSAERWCSLKDRGAFS